METKLIKLYNINELSETARTKALNKLREDEPDSELLSDYLQEEAEQLLRKHNIRGKPTLQYNLGYGQGSGCMFEGSFNWKIYRIIVKQSGHYTHENSKTFYITTRAGNYAKEDVDTEFNDLYVSICKELTKTGYSFIEDETSDERLIELCEINEWTFRENGTMENI